MIDNMLFTTEEIKFVMDKEYERLERIKKMYSSIDEYNKVKKKDNEEIIKCKNGYKLISDGIELESFKTKKETENYLKKESKAIIHNVNYILSESSNDYFGARISIFFYSLENADEETNDFIGKNANREEVLFVGNHVYFNMGDNYVVFNIHNLHKTTAKKVDYNDYVINKDAQKNLERRLNYV